MVVRPLTGHRIHFSRTIRTLRVVNRPILLRLLLEHSCRSVVCAGEVGDRCSGGSGGGKLGNCRHKQVYRRNVRSGEMIRPPCCTDL